MQKEPPGLLVDTKFYLDCTGSPCCCEGQTGVESVFQSVREDDAQIVIRNGEQAGECALYIHPHAGILSPFGKGSQNEIYCLVFTKAPHLLVIHFRVDPLNVLLGTVRLPIFDTRKQVLQMVAQVVAVPGCDGLGLP